VGANGSARSADFHRSVSTQTYHAAGRVAKRGTSHIYLSEQDSPPS